MVSPAELYALLGEVTPLPADCGEVCGAACCRGDEETGMLLFPCEAAPPFGRVLELDDRRLFVCDGRCDRDHRPLACRLFPLFPYVTEEGRIKAVYDPSAFAVCPLVQMRANVRLQRDFVRRVRRVGRRLMRTPDGRAFLIARSREIDELNRFVSLDSGRAPICRR